MNTSAIKLKNILKIYLLYERNLMDRFKDTFFPGKAKRYHELKALKHINLTIKKGEIVGMLGRNGAGKSTLAKVISGITKPTSGSMEIQGKIVPLLELGGGFNPDFTGYENIYFYCSLQGMMKKEIDRIYPDIVSFSELEDFIDVPVKKYSSGMKARLGFAVSVNINPDILILDEVLSVGDELFKRKCFVKMEEFFSSGKTIIYITHNTRSVVEICNRAILMHKGELLLDGHPELVVKQYRRLLSQNTSRDQEETVLKDIRLLHQNKELKLERHKKIIKINNIYNRLLEDIPVINKQESFFVEGFKSKSQKIIKKKNIKIKNYYLENTSGEEVNHLNSGETYIIKFSTEFNEEVEKIQFGCQIYNEKSFIITEHVYPSRINLIQKVVAREVLDYEVSFIAALNPGIYGIQFIVRGINNGQMRNISSLRDGIIFKVLERSEKYNNKGIVDLFIPIK